MAGVELTRIINLQITVIGKASNLNGIADKEEAADAVKKFIKECLRADDVLVTDVKDFVREVLDADM